MCSKHYNNFMRHGTPVLVPPSQAERFWAKVDKNGPGGCWVWTAYRDPNGYGKFNLGGLTGPIVLAHRFAWESVHGAPPPDGCDLDHLCRNPPCVNPAHLDPVSHRENMLRGVGNVAVVHAVVTHCPRGHEYTPENIYWHKRRYRNSIAYSRDCKTCVLAAQRRRLGRAGYEAELGKHWAAFVTDG